MEKSTRNRNIEHFRRLLKNNPDDVEREVLESLLAEEEASMREHFERDIGSQPNAAGRTASAVE